MTITGFSITESVQILFQMVRFWTQLRQLWTVCEKKNVKIICFEIF